MIKVFFDASVIFSALYSKEGASFKTVSLVRNKKILGVTTQTVVEEVERNCDKFGKIRFGQITQFIAENNFIVGEKISFTEISSYANVIHLKDAHVLAGAITAKCDYLVTLDRKHINTQELREKIRKVKITSPHELLTVLSKVEN